LPRSGFAEKRKSNLVPSIQLNLPSTSRLPNRRLVLKAVGASIALLSSTALTSRAFGQAQPAEPEIFPFSFDALTARMRGTAAGEYAPIQYELPPAFAGLDYDSYRRIQYRTDRAKWADGGSPYRIQAFHLGWLFPEPIRIFEVDDVGDARALQFSTDDFEYHNAEIGAAAAAEPFPGIAGFRVNYPLNSSETLDELISFVGASYFRALGRNNLYGLSARGLAVNSVLDIPEEFPRFSEFYLQRSNADGPLVIHAALDSRSVTGAYRFEITPGGESVQETVVDITARLFFRADIRELGVAPLTSMFLFSETNRADFDDYRPQVHDSNGLLIQRNGGDVMWRALNNTTTLGNSYFWEDSPAAFGLYQRGRNFEDYQDAGAHYERRPSNRIEPIGSWGQGSVRLIEMPTRLEGEDNIVAFWVPDEPVLAGQEREYRYLMKWGDLNPGTDPAMAYVQETRAGIGGVSGIKDPAPHRKFVIDYQGEELAALPPDTPLEIVATADGGTIVTSVVSKIEGDIWRVVIDVESLGPEPVELKVYLAGLDRKLTETWLYQWRAAA
jgi:periplasmic glucans biosynthesis protein